MGLFDSKSDSRTTSETTAIDTAENFEDSSAANLLNINLAGATVGNASGRGSTLTGDRGNNKKGRNGGETAGTGDFNSGVMVKVLDNDAIKKSFDFAREALSSASGIFSTALGGVQSANERAATTPTDSKDKYFLIAAALVLVAFFVWGRK